jgi:hypothetical protein
VYSTPILCAGCRAVRTIETDEGWARNCGPLTPDHMVGVASLGTLRTDPDAVLWSTNICLDTDDSLLLIDNGKLYLQDRVPEASLTAVHVYFPDPWPKRRHSGRRFFTDDVTAVLARAIRDDGHVFVATDNAGYGGQVARVMGAAVDFVFDEEERDRRIEAGPGHAFSPTNFERKYIEEGRIIRRYAFRRLPRR